MELLPEGEAHQAVDEEVHRGVDDQGQVVDGGEGQPDGPPVPGQVVEEAVDDPGGVAHQEHHHDGQQRLGGLGVLVVGTEEVAGEPVGPVDVPHDRAVEEEQEGEGDGGHEDHFGPQVVTHLVRLALVVVRVVVAAWGRVVMLKVLASTSQLCRTALQEDWQVEGDGDEDYWQNVGTRLLPGGTAETRLEGVTE